MRQHLLPSLIFLTVLISCLQKKENSNQEHLISDPIFREQIKAYLDTQYIFPTKESEFLIALANDDSIGLREQLDTIINYQIYQDTLMTDKLRKYIDWDLIRKQQDPNKLYYRFGLTSSLHPHIIFILMKADMIKNNYELEINKFSMTYKFPLDLDSIYLKKSMSISKQKWQEFERLINKSNFWDLTNINYLSGAHGSTWSLEGLTYGRFDKERTYHQYGMWSPKEGYFREACEYLITLTDEDFEVDKWY